MYFKNKYYFLNLKHTIKYKNFSKNTQLHKVFKLYDQFIRYYQQQIKNNLLDKNQTKILVRFANNFQTYLNIVQYIYIHNISINSYFKNHNSICKAQYYLIKNKLITKIEHPYLN